MPDPDATKGKAWKRAWAVVGGIALIVGLVTGALTLREKLAGTPTFKATIDTTQKAADFVDFLQDNDGKRVQLDVTCRGDSVCEIGDPSDQRYTDTMILSPEGPTMYQLDFIVDQSSAVQIDNGEYGAGTLVAKGPFSIVYRGQVGSVPEFVREIQLRGLPAQNAP